MSLPSLKQGDAESSRVPEQDCQADALEPLEWWQTFRRPTSLPVNLWSYNHDSDATQFLPIPTHNHLVSRPAAVQLSCYTDGPANDDDSEDLRLDPGLPGLRAVEDTVQCYEKAVGFHYNSFPVLTRADMGMPPPLNLSVDEQEIVDTNQTWSESLKDFISAVQDMILTACDDSLSSSFTGSEPSSGSDNSTEFFAMPLTPPLQQDAHLLDIFVKTASPNSSISSSSTDGNHFSTPVPVPAKSLNAFASSFIPSFSPPARTGASYSAITKERAGNDSSPKARDKSKSPSPSLSSFTFPTLHPPTRSTTRLTTVKIKKDEHGFFTDVQVDSAPKSDHAAAESPSHLLPPFLQEPAPRRRPRASRTREIVDRLRSSQSEAPAVLEDAEMKKRTLDFSFDLVPKAASLCPSPNYHDGAVARPRSSVSDEGAPRGRETDSSSSTPSQEDDDEGWIDLPPPAAPTTISKAKRARDLFLAFTRRRTDSISSEPAKEPSPQAVELSQGESQTVQQVPATRVAKTARSATAAREAWVSEATPAASPPAVAKSAASSSPANPTPTPSTKHRKKGSGQRQSNSTGSTTTYNAAMLPNLTGPCYLNVPLMTPSAHIMSSPAHRAAFFFNPAAAAYHPTIPVAFNPAAFVAPPAYAGRLPPPSNPYMTSHHHATARPASVASQHRKGPLSAW